VSGRDLLLAVDISGSMRSEDMVLDGLQSTRLQMVQAVAGDFIQRREGDRIGLILFGSRAYLQTPLTFDRTTVQTLLNEAEIGLAGKETAIGDAIGLAVKRLRELPATSNRVLVLLTDGANNAGEVDPLRAAELAVQLDLRIYTIGVGADEMMIEGLLGANRINPSADLDEGLLQEIAARTGGRYFRARATQELEQIYQLLNALEPITVDEEVYRPVRELYPWPLGAALVLSALLALARPSWRWRSVAVPP
jgi:Ca-activated chloride channel family protein